MRGLHDVVEKAKEAGEGVLEWATTTSRELAQAVEALERLVSVTLATMIADWKRGMEAAVTHLTELLEKEHAQHTVVQKEDFLVKVNHLQEALAHAFAALSTDGGGGHGAGGEQGGGGKTH